jgi:hypothetical protein
MSYLSISTWSLHRLLGPLRWTIWDADTLKHRTMEEAQPQILTLLELPAEAARRGYQAVEVCHFHFPSTEPSYLEQLRDAFASAQVHFDTLLLDYGDLTSEDTRRKKADMAFIRRWIVVASLCGAKRIRVIAGEAPPNDEEALSRAAAALSELSHFAASSGVEVITENFMSLTSTGGSCVKLLGQTEGSVEMITDFGNFKGPGKYDEIAMTVPYSVSIHAKADYDEEGLPDESEFRRCLETVHTLGYDGPYVLIYDGPGDMWAGLERIKRVVQPFIRSDINK